MTRFLIGTIPVVGHVNPTLPIERKLVERGHEVWWYAGIGFQSKVEATGARHVSISTGLDVCDLTTIPESFVEKRKRCCEENSGVTQLSAERSTFKS